MSIPPQHIFPCFTLDLSYLFLQMHWHIIYLLLYYQQAISMVCCIHFSVIQARLQSWPDNTISNIIQLSSLHLEISGNISAKGTRYTIYIFNWKSEITYIQLTTLRKTWNSYYCHLYLSLCMGLLYVSCFYLFP